MLILGASQADPRNSDIEKVYLSAYTVIITSQKIYISTIYICNVKMRNHFDVRISVMCSIQIQIQIQIILLHYNVLHGQTEFDPS